MILKRGISLLQNVPRGPNDAVMFDIDNTLILSHTQRVIPGVVDLLLYAKQHGYRIVIITARPGSTEIYYYTVAQLKLAEIPYDELYFGRDKNKIKRETGYRYVLSVGDSWSDLGESIHWIKLPTRH